MSQKQPINLVLSGGGTRAIGHLAIISALLERGFEIRAISGSSGGAIVGSLLASGKSPKECYELLLKTNFVRLFAFKMSQGGLFHLKRGEAYLEKILGIKEFSELSLPLYVCVVDLKEGRPFFLSEGNIAKAVIASSSISPFMRPVEMEGRMGADGGIMNNLPIEPFLGENLPIIGINVNPNRPFHSHSMVSIAKRALFLQFYSNILERSKLCSLYLEPSGIDAYTIYDLKSLESVYNLCQEWCKTNLDALIGDVPLHVLRS